MVYEGFFLSWLTKIRAAEVAISWMLGPGIGQAPKPVNPTFPIMQHDSIF